MSTKKPAKKTAAKKKSPAKKAVKKTTAKKKPAKKAVKKSPAKKAAKKATVKKSPAKKAVNKTSAKPASKTAKPEYDDLLQKILDKFSEWSKSLFDEDAIRKSAKSAGKTAGKIQAQVKSKIRFDEDDFLRDLLDNDPELQSWTSVSTVNIDGKKGTSTRKWLLLFSNGEVGFINRGESKSPEAAIAKSRKNVKHITNARAAIKSAKLEKYTITFGQVANKQIEIKLDPATAPNAETAKQFVSKIKKFI